jgi:hypothetical protein
VFIGVVMKIVITIFLVLVLALSVTVGLDEGAMKIQDESFNRAMVAFGLAKGLNAVISLLQGTELTVTPVGVGLNFSVGEVLDPFNDMVERFSWVMLFASVSLGVQKLLLVLSSKIFLQAAMGVSVFATLLFMWIKKIKSHTFFIISFKIFLLILLLRFGTVLFVYSSELLYDSVLKQEFISSSKVVEETKNKLENIEEQNKAVVQSKNNSSVLSNISTRYNALSDSLNISRQLDSLNKSIEDASIKIINIITIFIVNSILMPLLFIWLFIESTKLIFRSKFDDDSVSVMLNKASISV